MWFLVFSREVLQEVLDTDLSNEAFPFSTHKVANAAGHQVSARTRTHTHTHTCAYTLAHGHMDTAAHTLTH